MENKQIGLKKNDIIENLLVEKLVFSWAWLARLKHSNPDLDWRVVMISWWAIPWAIVNVRVLKKKKNFIEGQIIEVIKKSPIEKENKNNKYWFSGAWKWINIPYSEQLKIKESQVKESFKNLEKYGLVFLPITASPIEEWYRNKVEFSFWKYISHRNNIEEHFNLGFHKPWDFSKVEDYDGTPLIDEEQNEIFREIKAFAKTLGLPAYDQMKNEWFFRHLLIRKTYFTNEMMILLSFNPEYFNKNTKLNKEEKLSLIKGYLVSLADKYKNIKSIYFSHNTNKADIAIWDLELIYWIPVITEELLWLKFNISPTSFFQTNSAGAEKLYSIVIDFAWDLKDKKVLDLYAWTGTIWMIMAKAWAKEVVSVELVTSASLDAIENAKLNELNNMSFVNKKVEDFLWDYLEQNDRADLIVLDPPRNWMHPKALKDILEFDTKQIIYVSCNPATLVRDLQYILENSDYEIEKISPVDMFPHTHHIETVVSLRK